MLADVGVHTEPSKACLTDVGDKQLGDAALSASVRVHESKLTSEVHRHHVFVGMFAR
ncbi:hypothetical protein LX86_002103 [Lentzea aerocolonigenes]|nr:hypothetical protein [Lentzea aerocolonigenes]